MSLLDRIDALPAETIHKIFEYYWDLSPVQTMYQLEMEPRDTFSVSTHRQPLDIGRTSDPESPYNDARIDLTPRHTRQNTQNYPMLRSMAVSLAGIEQIIAFESNSTTVEKFAMSALTYTLLLPKHPNIRIHSLLVLLKRNPGRESDDIQALSRTLDATSIDFTTKRQPSRTPISTRLSEQSLHFKTAEDLNHYFYADMSRAVQIQSFSYGCTASDPCALDVLKFLFWSLGTQETCLCGAKEIYTIAHTKQYTTGSVNVDSQTGPLRAFVVRSTDDSVVDNRFLPDTRYPARRTVFALEELSLDASEAMSIEELRNFRQTHTPQPAVHWPPKYISYSARDQKRLKSYLSKLLQVSGTHQIRDLAGNGTSSAQ